MIRGLSGPLRECPAGRRSSAHELRKRGVTRSRNPLAITIKRFTISLFRDVNCGRRFLVAERQRTYDAIYDAVFLPLAVI